MAVQSSHNKTLLSNSMKGIIVAIAALIATSSFGQNTWTQKDSVNGAPRSVSSMVMLNGEAYIIGGLDENGFRRKMYSYLFSQDDWDQELSIGGANGAGLNRGSAAAFSIGFSAFVVGGQGQTNGFFEDTWEFDLVTQTWTQVADFAGGFRRQAVGFAIDTLGYVGTGYSPTGFKKDMYSYDPGTNTWTQLNDFGGTARKEAVGFTMGGQAYVGTGDDGVMKNDFWQYEPSTDTWTQKTSCPATARKGAVGWGLFPNAFICAGEDINSLYQNDLWEYNYYLDTWVQRADMPGPGRAGAIAFPLVDQGFVTTGYNGIFLDDMYAYSPLLGIDDLIAEANVTVYPNPAVEHCTIATDLEGLECSIYSISGKLMNDHLSIMETNEGFNVKRTGAASGTYFVRLSDPHFGTVYTGKIIFK